jgi:hypothetical protein
LLGPHSKSDFTACSYLHRVRSISHHGSLTGPPVDSLHSLSPSTNDRYSLPSLNATMARNATFHPEREPLRHVPELQLDQKRIGGPFYFLNPTQAHYRHVPKAKASSAPEQSEGGRGEDVIGNDETPASDIGYKWTSRNNRKGRHALVIQPSSTEDAKYATPPPTANVKHVLQVIGKMFTYYPVWDVSWLVAYVFTWGSVIWVINAFFALLPFTNPNSEFAGEVLYGGGITAFIGATVFEIGSVLLMLEAVNENRTGCFGWAVEQLYEGSAEHSARHVKPEGCSHHHLNKGNLVGKAAATGDSTDKSEKSPNVVDGTPPGERSWVWWPSW